MLELSLFGQIPASRHDQVLKILAGIAAMAPKRTTARHLVFKPTRPPGRPITQVGGSQGIQDSQKAARQAQVGGDLYYLQLVEDMTHEITEKDGKGGLKQAALDEVPRGEWTLHFYDVPEPGKRPVMARSVSITEVLEGDAVGFVEKLGYQFVHQYLVEGHQVVHHNVILHLHRILRIPETIARQPRLLPGSIPPIQQLIPLDESAAYTLQAFIKVLDGSKPDIVARGTAELSKLKEVLRGSIDLRVVDRLSLDTRVK